MMASAQPRGGMSAAPASIGRPGRGQLPAGVVISIVSIGTSIEGDVAATAGPGQPAFPA
jgi:hypothetical protein